MTDLRQAAQQALEALEMLARYENPETKIQVRKPKDGGPIVTMYPHKVATDAGVALRTAIAEAEKQEPVAWMFQHDETGRMNYVSNDGMNTPELFLKGNPRYAVVCPLYTTPPAAQQRKPLTDYKIWQMVNDCMIGGDLHADKFARAIEAAHGIKERT